MYKHIGGFLWGAQHIGTITIQQIKRILRKTTRGERERRGDFRKREQLSLVWCRPSVKGDVRSLLPAELSKGSRGTYNLRLAKNFDASGNSLQNYTLSSGRGQNGSVSAASQLIDSSNTIISPALRTLSGPEPTARPAGGVPDGLAGRGRKRQRERQNFFRDYHGLSDTSSAIAKQRRSRRPRWCRPRGATSWPPPARALRAPCGALCWQRLPSRARRRASA